MQSNKNPDYLRATTQAVVDFRDTLEEFLTLHVMNEIPRGFAPAVLPRDDADREVIKRLRVKTDRAAGRAVSATPLTKSYLIFQNAGKINPISAWYTMTQPKSVLEPGDVLSACDQAIGRLEAMIFKIETKVPPVIGLEAMHPLVRDAANRLWHSGHYRESVTAAAEALMTQVKVWTQRNDVADTSLWQEAFSSKDPEPKKPRLRWPGSPSDLDVKNMNVGLRQLAPGMQMTIRNTTAHMSEKLDKQEALEMLATLSLLARWVNKCELVKFTE